MSAAKEAGGKGETDKDKQPAAQKKRTSTTSQAPPLLQATIGQRQADSCAAEVDEHHESSYAFAAALAAMPSEDCLPACLPADRTIMLRMASKRVREVVDKARLPAVVRLSRSFWDDARNGTKKKKRQVVLRQLTAMAARCRITTLELHQWKSDRTR